MNTPRHGGARSPVIVLLFAALSSAHQTAQNIRLLATWSMNLRYRHRSLFNRKNAIISRCGFKRNFD
jgi:hypothetical protein